MDQKCEDWHVKVEAQSWCPEDTAFLHKIKFHEHVNPKNVCEYWSSIQDDPVFWCNREPEWNLIIYI